MTNALEVKNVPFMGADLIAARDENDVIWAGVSYICNGIGFNKNEKDRQVKNVQTDLVLQRGCVKFDAGVFDENNRTIAIKIDYLPLWLAKISITPAMQRDSPELVERLLQYQLKAAKVLADAFLPIDATGKLREKPTEKTVDTDHDKARRAALREKEARTRAARLWVQMAKATKDETMKRIYLVKAEMELTGTVVTELPAMPERTYSAEDIGRELGITANRVGRLANQYGLKTAEYCVVVYDTAKGNPLKQVQTVRYYWNVVEALRPYVPRRAM